MDELEISTAKKEDIFDNFLLDLVAGKGSSKKK
jgi:hypothetical protein